MGRVVCTESSGLTEATGVSSRVLALTFHLQLSQVDLVAPSQVPDVMLHQVVVARKNNHCSDIVCFV